MIILFVAFYLLVALGFALEMAGNNRPEESVGFAIFCGLLWPCLLGVWLHNQTKDL